LVAPDQFTGCLIAQYLGDAPGFLVEGFPTEDMVAATESTVEFLSLGRSAGLRKGNREPAEAHLAVQNGRLLSR
jgi:hypothetical protein